jgi:hypothetical protein
MDRYFNYRLHKITLTQAKEPFVAQEEFTTVIVNFDIFLASDIESSRYILTFQSNLLTP